MSINKDWHEQHRMSRNPTLQQRIDWHIKHEKHCSCRPMPANLRKLLDEKKLS